MKNGWPPEIAFALDQEYALAISIINSEFEGATFDPEGWRFVKQD